MYKTELTLLNSGSKPVSILRVFSAGPDVSSSFFDTGIFLKHLKCLDILLDEATAGRLPPTQTEIWFNSSAVLQPGRKAHSVVTATILGEEEVLSLTYVSFFHLGENIQGIFSGKLVVVTNDENPAHSRLEIPYRLRVLHGEISYDEAQTQFALPIWDSHSLEKGLDTSNSFVTNDSTCFFSNLSISNATFICDRKLSFSNKFSTPLTLDAAVIHDSRFRCV